MKILLVNPASPDNFWGLRHARDLCGFRAYLPSLALPTLAAMVPVGIEVAIRDENVGEIDLDEEADLVGITGCDLQAEGVVRLAQAFRARGRPVVVGGPYASLSPAFCQPYADAVVVGEGERVFPRFLDDFLGGRHQRRYEEYEAVDLRHSPVPRWDLVRLGDYERIPLQTTREGAEISTPGRTIGYGGSRFRAKPVTQISEELDVLLPYLQRAGRDTIFLADEDFAGNPLHARAVCQALVDHNRHLARPLRFDAQATPALAEDGELLELMAEAGCESVYLYMKRPRRSEVEETDRRRDADELAERVHAIQAAGIFVWAGFDDAGASGEEVEALGRAGVLVAEVGASTAASLRDFYSYESYAHRLEKALAAIESPRLRRPGLPGLAQLGRGLGQLARLLGFYLFTRDRARRRFFLDVVFNTLRTRPGCLREALWHVALHKHFHRLVAAGEEEGPSLDRRQDGSRQASPVHQAA